MSANEGSFFPQETTPKTHIIVSSVPNTYKVSTPLSYFVKQKYVSLSHEIPTPFFLAFFLFNFLLTPIHLKQYIHVMETVSI